MESSTIALHAKLDEIREQKWVELIEIQQRQLELPGQITRRDLK